jgi:hypothetical protein
MIFVDVLRAFKLKFKLAILVRVPSETTAVGPVVKRALRKSAAALWPAEKEE